MAKTRKAAPQAGEIESTCLVKGKERFIITYVPSRIPDAIRVLERWAADPELSMTPFDAAVFACQLRKGASPGGIQDADAAFEALCELLDQGEPGRPCHDGKGMEPQTGSGRGTEFRRPLVETDGAPTFTPTAWAILLSLLAWGVVFGGGFLLWEAWERWASQ